MSASSVQEESTSKIRLHFSRVDFDTTLLVTSEKRKVHGPQLVIFPTPNIFENNNGPAHTIDLPCGARHTSLSTPTAMEFAFHSWFPSGDACLPQIAGLAFELTARHCKSDKQQEVCHTYGYGVLSLGQLARIESNRYSTSTTSAGKTMYSFRDPVTITLVDRPMQFEFEFAHQAIESGAHSEEYTKLTRLEQAFVRAANGAECFDRMRITLHGIQLELPSGVRLTTRQDARALTPAVRERAHEFHADDFAFVGASESARKAAERLRRVFTEQCDRTYAPYGGQASFTGYSAMDSMWQSYFVPKYKRGCGIDEPSALALMCTWFDRRVPERLFSHLLRAQLTVHGMSIDRFLQSLRGVLAAHAKWVESAPERHRTGPAKHARMDEWQRDSSLSDKQQLTVDEQRCLGFVVAALTSMANACCYTTDFAEIAKLSVGGVSNKEKNSSQAVQGIEEIVTEQFETAPLRVRAIDCEDGAAWFMRLWFSLVTNLGVWNDPVVALSAHVMDLYVVCINKMHCGECHIMPTLYLRDCALGMLLTGYSSAMAKEHSDVENKRWFNGIYQTCLWPSYMYQGGCPGSVGHRTDVIDMMKRANGDCTSIKWPIPHVLYAEPTRASPSNQMPTDTYENSDSDQVHRRRAKHQLRMSAVDCLSRVDMDTFGGLEPYITFPSMISTEEALANPLSLSRFYRGFVMGCMIPPVYRLVLDDLNQSLGRSDGLLHMTRTEQALQQARFFADVSYYDVSKPKTFGVYHVQVAGNDPHVCAIPYAPLDLELLLWVAHVHGVEPPVLPGRLPSHLERVPLECLGQFETVPHVVSFAPLEQILHDGDRYRELLLMSNNDNDGVNAIDGSVLSEKDRALQQCVDVRFLPHNGSMSGAYVHHAAKSASGSICRGVYVRRIPLAVAPQPSHHISITDDDASALQSMMSDLHLKFLDATQMVPLVDNKKKLLELAQQYGVLERYTPQQWNALRHYMGAQVRHAPLYLNYVCFACDAPKR